MKDLAGKTAFVTGAASGIGLGIATALAQAGVKVMLCDIEEAALAQAVEALKRTNVDVDGVKADVSLSNESRSGGQSDLSALRQGAHSHELRRRQAHRWGRTKGKIGFHVARSRSSAHGFAGSTGPSAYCRVGRTPSAKTGSANGR